MAAEMPIVDRLFVVESKDAIAHAWGATFAGDYAVQVRGAGQKRIAAAFFTPETAALVMERSDAAQQHPYRVAEYRRVDAFADVLQSLRNIARYDETRDVEGAFSDVPPELMRAAVDALKRFDDGWVG